ncbi:MAG: hypothetical protein ACREBQ_09995, partial [Nitrososphaerales archaeon]
ASVAVVIILLAVGIGVLGLAAIGSGTLCFSCSSGDRDLSMTLMSATLYSGTATTNISRGLH